jgi:ribosomal protein S27E
MSHLPIIRDYSDGSAEIVCQYCNELLASITPDGGEL